MFPKSKSGSTPSKFDRLTEKLLFLESQSLMDSSKKVELLDTFSSCVNFFLWRKWGKFNLFSDTRKKLIYLFLPLWLDWVMAERQVIKEKYRKSGLFDFLHFTLPCSPLGRPTLALARLSRRLPFYFSLHSICLSSFLLGGVSTDPLIQEVSAFVTVLLALFWFLISHTSAVKGNMTLPV